MEEAELIFEYEGAPPKKDPGAAAADKLIRAFPNLTTFKSCPQCGFNNLLFGMVMHLNDYHRWERESIADWLDTLDEDFTFPPPEDK